MHKTVYNITGCHFASPWLMPAGARDCWKGNSKKRQQEEGLENVDWRPLQWTEKNNYHEVKRLTEDRQISREGTHWTS